MPESIDGNIALEAVQRVAHMKHGIDSRKMTEIEFHNRIKQVSFDWELAGKYAELPKQRIKRWFMETYQRQISEPIDKEDAKMIREQMQLYSQSFPAPSKVQLKQFQLELIAKLSK